MEQMGQFSFPEKLYGREAEKKILSDIFISVVSTKKSAAALISGYSGIGKTRLVREAISTLAEGNAFFATGNFQQQENLIPYEGLQSALNHILELVMALTYEEQESYREAIHEEVGVLLSAIEDFLPKMKDFLGEAIPLPTVGIEETKNRFELAILQLIRALSKKKLLVLFLEDIHWADTPMLFLLKKILTSEDVENVFFILSYRNNNVSPSQPFFDCLAAAKQEGKIPDIELSGLNKTAIVDMLHDSLSLPHDEVYDLALSLEKKTQGNPFFLRTLLEEFYENKVLYFSKTDHRWHWDQDKVEAAPVMENVANYVNQRIEALPSDIKNVLHVAACIGSTFTSGEIENTALFKNDTILNALELAVKKDIIFPVKNRDEFLFSVGIWDKDHQFSFHHNNIQTACYNLKNVDESNAIHLCLARKIYEKDKESNDTSKLLLLTNQYNRGSSKINDLDEIKILCKLNHDASNVAMKSAAYAQAYLYDKNAVELLEKTDLFTENYSLAFDTYFSYIESSFLAKNFDLSDEIAEKVLKFSKNNFDKARVYTLKGNLGRVMGINKDYIAYFEEGLRVLGYPLLAKKPSIIDVLMAIIQFKIKFLSEQVKLRSLPQKRDPEQSLIYSLVEKIAEECYFAADILRYAYVVTLWGASTYEHHNRELRAAFYSANGVLWPKSKSAYRHCVEAYNYTSHAPINEVCAVTTFVTNVLNFGWHIPWSNVVGNARRSTLQLEQIGNFELYAYSLVSVCYYDLSQACDKSSVEFEYLTRLTKNISPRAWTTSMAHWQFYRNMCAECAFDVWVDDIFDEKEVIRFCNDYSYKAPITFLFYSKLRFAAHAGTLSSRLTERDYLLNELSEILHRNNVFDSITTIMFIFMCDIHRYPKLSFLAKIKVGRTISRLYRMVKSWKRISPKNFQHFVTFMGAELARRKGKYGKAIRLYKTSIPQSEEIDALEYIGLAQQRLASLELEQGHPQEATIYFRAAIETYENWHAYGISRHLKEVHKDLLKS